MGQTEPEVRAEGVKEELHLSVEAASETENAKLEEESKQKAEAEEAKAKQEEETRLKEAEAAKTKEEEEARLKAEAEKAKQEEEKQQHTGSYRHHLHLLVSGVFPFSLFNHTSFGRLTSFSSIRLSITFLLQL